MSNSNKNVEDTHAALVKWSGRLVDYLWDDEQRNFAECDLDKPGASREQIEASAYFAVGKLANAAGIEIPLKWIASHPSL